MMTITLRAEQTEQDTRFLGATLRQSGELVIEGQDIGAGVEAVYGDGMREYEWAYTLTPDSVAMLRNALGAQDDILAALAARFSDDRAADLQPFLDAHAIPYEFWSRLGE